MLCSSKYEGCDLGSWYEGLVGVRYVVFILDVRDVIYMLDMSGVIYTYNGCKVCDFGGSYELWDLDGR